MNKATLWVGLQALILTSCGRIPRPGLQLLWRMLCVNGAMM